MTTATRAQRPRSYSVLLELGWYWAITATSSGHLVPPEGDRARCGQMIPRQRRIRLERPTGPTTCERCRRSVGLS